MKRRQCENRPKIARKSGPMIPDAGKLTPEEAGIVRQSKKDIKADKFQ